MRLRTATALVLLAACGSRPAPPPTVGGTPSTPPAGAWDPADLPRTVALAGADGRLTLARVTTDGVEVGATVPAVGPDRGWLDGHTLVGLTELENAINQGRIFIDGRWWGNRESQAGQAAPGSAHRLCRRDHRTGRRRLIVFQLLTSTALRP